MTPSEHSILVVEDEHSLRAVAARQLRQTYTQVLEADSVARALALLQTERVDVILVDIHLQDGSGFEILDALAKAGASPAVVVMTADRNIDNAIGALQRHAHGFLLKPFEFPELEAALTKAIDGRAPRAAQPHAPVAPLHSWRNQHAPDLLGDDPSLLRVFRTVQQVCDTDCSVMITGESGTGKELVARALHAGSARAHGPFVTVNCAAIPENLLESELFGHV